MVNNIANAQLLSKGFSEPLNSCNTIVQLNEIQGVHVKLLDSSMFIVTTACYIYILSHPYTARHATAIRCELLMIR